jgi:hypothetical protein
MLRDALCKIGLARPGTRTFDDPLLGVIQSHTYVITSMKNRPNVSLSLRKLFTAMLAVGPVAILPSPVWAALPTSAFYTVQNGSATVNTVGNVATISTSDRTVLQWGAGNFTIGFGETYNFQMPAGGAVLNRLNSGDTATIAGGLDSNGRVFVLAPGGTINVHQNAAVTASGGLVLSTLAEDNGTFITSGNLMLVPAAAGNGQISIGIANPNLPVGTTPIAPSFSSTLTAVGGQIAVASMSANGDAVIRSVTSGNAVSLGSIANAAGGGITVLGNLSVTATNADIVQAAAAGTITANSLDKVATFTTTGSNSITLDNVANDFRVVSLNTLVGTAPAGAVTVVDSDQIFLANSTLGGSLAVVAAGNTSANGSSAISTVGTLTVAGDATFTKSNDGRARTGISITQNSTIGGVLSGSAANNSSFSFTGVGNVLVGSISASNSAATGTSGGITINTTGAISFAAGSILATTGNNATNGGAISLTGSAINATNASLTAGNGTRNGSVTLNATAGDLTVGTATSNKTFTLRAAAGNITQATGTTLTSLTASTVSNTYTHVAAALGDISLAGSNALQATNVVQLSGGNAILENTAGLVLGSTNLTGNLSVTATGADTNVTLGAGSGTLAQSVVVGGDLNVNLVNGPLGARIVNTGDVLSNSFSPLTVTGAVNLKTSGGDVTIDAATKNGAIAPAVRLGAFNVTNEVDALLVPLAAGNVTVAETTTLNLGNVRAQNLVAQSTQGGVIDSGSIAVLGTATFAVTANNSIALDGTGNTFVGTVGVAGSGEASIASTSGITIASTSPFTGNLAVSTATGSNINVGPLAITGGLSLASGGNVDFANSPVLPATTAPVAVSGNLSVLAAGSITQTGTGGIVVGGVTSVAAGSTTAPADITLGGANEFGSVVINATSKDATINDVSNLTISGSAAGTVTATAGGTGAIANAWALTLGNLTVNSLVANAGNGGSGSSGTITQATGSSVNSFDRASFTTQNANIVLGNSGNNFGRVEVFTNATANRTVTIVEENTLRLGNVNSQGTTNLTSRVGSIIEDPSVSANITNNGTLALNAPNGSVLIGGTTTRADGTITTVGSVTAANITAPNGAAAIFTSSTNFTLGSVNTNTLTVNHTGSGNFTQSAAARVFGSASFKSGGNLTLSNTTNNFGRVSLETTAASKNITVTEAGTLNLGTVTMPGASTGNFTATSVSGDIIDTGVAGLKVGGTKASYGTGVVSLNAAAGNITLDDPTTDFFTSAGVVFNAVNVTLAPLGDGPIYLGSATANAVATGNLTVSTSLSTGSILSKGSVQVGGNAIFNGGGDVSYQATDPLNALGGTAEISLTGSANKFGTLRFVGKMVTIIESDDTAIVTGSLAKDATALASGGSISVIDRGGSVSFNGATTTLSAAGNITLSKPVKATGILSVSAPGTKDLSALSKSADLNNKEPNNSGTGAYLPPGQ